MVASRDHVQGWRSDGAMVKALVSHQCGPGSIPRLAVICRLSLLVLYSAPTGFLRVLRFYPLLKNQHFTRLAVFVKILRELLNQGDNDVKGSLV